MSRQVSDPTKAVRDLRALWQSNWDRHARVDSSAHRVCPWYWPNLLKTVVSRKMPLKVTFYHMVYTTCITGPFMYFHGHPEPGKIPENLALAGAAVEHLIDNHNLLQGVTGFLASAVFLMLSFRLNRAHSRWWEGAAMFSELQTASRSLTLMSQAALKNQAAACHLGMLSYTYARSVEFHLRRVDKAGYIALCQNLLTPEQLEALLAAPQRPLYLAQHLTAQIARAHDLELCKNERMAASLADHVPRMMKATAGMQRMASLNEPFAYQRHLRLVVKLWLNLLPLALLPSLEWLTPVLSTTIAYTVYKMDDVAVELTNPFGLDRSDLGICLMNDRLQLETHDMLRSYLHEGAPGVLLGGWEREDLCVLGLPERHPEASAAAEDEGQ